MDNTNMVAIDNNIKSNNMQHRAEEELENLTGTKLSKETSELVKREDIPDSPFKLITTEEGNFITMGKYRLTDVYETKEEALDYMKTWNFMFQVILTLMNDFITIKTN